MIQRKDSTCTECYTKGNKVNKEKYIQAVYKYKVIIHGHTELYIGGQDKSRKRGGSDDKVHPI